MNRELAYAISFLFFLLSSLFYSNLIIFDQQSLFRFNFSSYIVPNNTKTLLPIEVCDFSKGQWVWDEAYNSHQLYDEKCPFLDPGFRCRQNGRNDEGYRKWRWQPDDCNLPRFNASDLLERSRNGRILFAGRPPPNSAKDIKMTIRLDELHWYSNKWKEADVLVFNSGHWWNPDKTIKAGIYFQEGGKLFAGSLQEWHME
ncbi:unnamed protein product [Vicia faba]|uniref:Trichome birefringence-like N-terminal domain-containing protein n=1 Tax=Vicia faba TaxID=3906 RepID=A0AAV0ZVK7_VICFA|nr:unnamed protein product [Vicia faba]